MKNYCLLFYFAILSGMVLGEENSMNIDTTFAGEEIEVVYLPKSGVDAFSVVKTNNAFYEIRTGVYRKLDCFEYSKYNEYESPKKGIIVKTVWTDSENLYLELMDSTFVGIGFLEISGDGVMLEAVHYYNSQDIIEGDFDFENNEWMTKLSTID